MADHGTNTGWDDSLAVDGGAGPAIFHQFKFAQGFYRVDGQVRNSLFSGYGFVFDNSALKLDQIISLTGKSGIVLRFAELVGDGVRSGLCRRAIYNPSGGKDNLFEYLYLHDWSAPFLLTGKIDGLTIQHNYMARSHTDPRCHGEAIADDASDNVIIRYNRIVDAHGTGCIVQLSRGGPGTAENWNVYGNVCWFSSDPVEKDGWGNGWLACINGRICTNWQVHHNTVVNGRFGLSTRIHFAQAGPGSSVVAKNNLWVCQDAATRCRNAQNSCRAGVTCVYENNAYSAQIPANVEKGKFTLGRRAPASLFVDWTRADFHLARDVGPRASTLLDPLYDPDGVQFTSSVGAFQFNSPAIALRIAHRPN